VRYQYLHSLSVTEASTFDHNSRVALPGLVEDFVANVLALSIAVSPDEENCCIASLLLDVLRNGLLVLRCLLVFQIIRSHRTDIVNIDHGRCVEELTRLA